MWSGAEHVAEAPFVLFIRPLRVSCCVGRIRDRRHRAARGAKRTRASGRAASSLARGAQESEGEGGRARLAAPVPAVPRRGRETCIASGSLVCLDDRYPSVRVRSASLGPWLQPFSPRSASCTVCQCKNLFVSKAKKAFQKKVKKQELFLLARTVPCLREPKWNFHLFFLLGRIGG